MTDQLPHPGAPEQPAAGRLLLAVRRQTGAVVFVLEGGEELEVAPDAVPHEPPGPGDHLDAPLLEELRSAAARKRAARCILAILDRRLVPVARVRRKVIEDGCDPAAVDAVLAQLAARELYSDRRYADAWCRECLASRAVGRRYLEARLRDKGVTAPLAREAARAALDDETEAELAAAAARSRWQRVRRAPDRRAEAAVVRYLQGRGFAAGLAARAARAARPAAGNERNERNEP